MEEKFRVEFKDSIPRVVHFDKFKAPRGAEEVTIDDVTFWVEEVTYMKAMSKMYTASLNMKNDDLLGSQFATAMIKYVLDDLSDATFALMLYGFKDWHTYIDMVYAGPVSSVGDQTE